MNFIQFNWILNYIHSNNFEKSDYGIRVFRNMGYNDEQMEHIGYSKVLQQKNGYHDMLVSRIVGNKRVYLTIPNIDGHIMIDRDIWFNTYAVQMVLYYPTSEKTFNYCSIYFNYDPNDGKLIDSNYHALTGLGKCKYNETIYKLASEFDHFLNYVVMYAFKHGQKIGNLGYILKRWIDKDKNLQYPYFLFVRAVDKRIRLDMKQENVHHMILN